MNIRYVVELSNTEREELASLISDRKTGSQKRKRAQLLLACDRGITDVMIARTLPCGESTIYRTKKRFVEEGLQASLNEQQRLGKLYPDPRIGPRRGGPISQFPCGEVLV